MPTTTLSPHLTHSAVNSGVTHPITFPAIVINMKLTNMLGGARAQGQVTLNTRVGRSPELFGHSGEEGNLLPLARIRPPLGPLHSPVTMPSELHSHCSCRSFQQLPKSIYHVNSSRYCCLFPTSSNRTSGMHQWLRYAAVHKQHICHDKVNSLLSQI